MYQELIKKNIHLLQPNHVKEYAKKENIILSNQETLILYHFIKNHYVSLLEDNTIILELEKILPKEIYDSIYSLYQKYKKFFKK